MGHYAIVTDGWVCDPHQVTCQDPSKEHFTSVLLWNDTHTKPKHDTDYCQPTKLTLKYLTVFESM